MSQFTEDLERCPSCGTNWRDKEIPEVDRELYGGKTHFTRVIGISDGDSIYAWRCPDCREEFKRESGPTDGFRTCDVIVIGELGEELSAPSPENAVESLRGLMQAFGLDLQDVLRSKWDDPERPDDHT